MTYDQDPARWTSSPEEAPELLRGAFVAARNEGPNQAQMRSLAIKIAAVSAGGAVAVGAAKATAAGNAAATAATWSIGKLAGVLAIAGSIAAGAAIWKTEDATRGAPSAKPTSAVSATPSAQAPAASAVPTPAEPSAEVSARSTTQTGVAAPAVEAPIQAPERAAPVAPSGSSSSATPRSASATPAHNAPVSVASQRSSTSSSAQRKSGSSSPRASESGSSSANRSATITAPGAPRTISEVELLRSAQQALRGRPREAYQLTEQHRQLYPAGEFAQERDALAIQALLRAGETEMARDLAVSFIKAHPSSPHAHQFREAMGIR